MGEYAKFRGEEVKIGTCEAMYYLRYQDRERVEPIPGSLNPADPEIIPVLHWRFPWPDEDHIGPGADGYHDKGYDRSIHIPKVAVPEGVEHRSVQFVASGPGYLLSLPCPESADDWKDATGDPMSGRIATRPDIAGLRVGKNGYRGAVHLHAQKFVPGIGLVPILRCGGCGSLWRVEDRHEIEALAVALRSEGDRLEHYGNLGEPRTGTNDRRFHDTVADRLLEGAGIVAEVPA